MLRATATDKNAVQDAAADEDENLKKKKSNPGFTNVVFPPC